jgi:hypothetical protein
MGLAWWTGLAIAPTLGTQMLSHEPAAVFLVAAGIAAVACVSTLSLERARPEASRLTPHPTGASAEKA